MKLSNVETVAQVGAGMLAQLAATAGVEEHEVPEFLEYIIRDLVESKRVFIQRANNAQD